VHARQDARTRAAATRIRLTEDASEQLHDSTFEACKNSLADMCKLAQRDPQKRLCVSTDASEYFWTAIVTQVLNSTIHWRFHLNYLPEQHFAEQSSKKKPALQIPHE
jgi:hypothetical protein